MIEPQIILVSILFQPLLNETAANLPKSWFNMSAVNYKINNSHSKSLNSIRNYLQLPTVITTIEVIWTLDSNDIASIHHFSNAASYCLSIVCRIVNATFEYGHLSACVSMSDCNTKRTYIYENSTSPSPPQSIRHSGEAQRFFDSHRSVRRPPMAYIFNFRRPLNFEVPWSDGNGHIISLSNVWCYIHSEFCNGYLWTHEYFNGIHNTRVNTCN